MKKIMLTCGAILLFIFTYFTNIFGSETSLDKNQLTLFCKGNVHFDLQIPDSRVTMEGSVSLTTLGSQRLAIGFSGQLSTDKGRFILDRTLMMNTRYHPENHVLELEYVNNIARGIDTAPDDIFYDAFIRSNALILKISRFSNNALLISDNTSPLYVCIAQ